MDTLSVIDPVDIEDLVATIWATTIARPVEAQGPPPCEPATDVLSSSVTIAGDWNGGVVFQCPLALAETLTSAMFGMPRAELADADVEDALGELANMMAGNIKALLPGQNHLGLPVVALGGPHRVALPTSAPVHHVAFSCEGKVFSVTVVERTPDLSS